MRHSIMLVILLASAGYSQEPAPAAEGTVKHESAEDKARTVPGGASLGVKACHADIERWCKDVEPGEGRLGACLKGKMKKLSKRCRRWASHGGKQHMAESLARDIDGAPAPAPEKK